jgi:nitronate monooxygenase
MAFDTAFTRMLGCRYPLQQAALGGLSSPDLAIAVSRAGGFGMLSGTVGHEALVAQLNALPSGSNVGVNFLVPFLDPGALELASRRCPLVELFWGEPDVEVIEVVHAGGARAGWQIGSVEEARAARDVGCDLVVAQGVEAGGHVRGTTTLLALIDQVRAAIDVPIVAAGGIGTGQAMAAALAAGADAVRVGTRFVAATETKAHPGYVQRLIESSADDTVLTTAFGDGWPDAPHRVLTSAVLAGESLGAAQSWSPAWPTIKDTGPVESRALYAGQSVGAVRCLQPAADIVAELIEAAEQAHPHEPGSV